MRALRGIGCAPLVAIAAFRYGRLVAEPCDGYHLFALVDLEEHHALGLAAGYADVGHRAADELTTVGHQHDLVAMGDRKRGYHKAIAVGHLDGCDAGAAAPGDAVFIGRAAL